MKRLYILLMASLFLASCSKEAEAPKPEIFGEKTLQSPEGSFLILFKGEGVWSVSSDKDWIHVEERLYKDEAAFEVRYDSNESTIGDHRFCRKGHVNITSENGTWRNVMVLKQEGLAPYISLVSRNIPQEEGTYSLVLESNLTDRERAAISFSSDAAWITDIALGRDNRSVVFNVSPGSSRSGNIVMTFTDEWERRHTASASVNQ